MKYQLAELINTPVLASLLDSLYESSGIPSAVIDIEGRILTGAGWQKICTEFHRKHPETEKACIDSDTRLAAELNTSKGMACYQCPLGLVDSATAIMVDGEHLGNVFTGQLFLDPPDEARFRDQARHYGFDMEAYIEALHHVPIITREKLEANLRYIAQLTEMIAERSLANKRDKIKTQQLEELAHRYRGILKTTADGFLLLDSNGRLLDVNSTYCLMSGYTRDELLGMVAADLDVIETRDEVLHHIAHVLDTGFDRFETRHRRKDGSLMDVEISASVLAEDRRIVAFLRDVTERKSAENVLRESEYFFKSAQRAAFIGSYKCDFVADAWESSEVLDRIFGIGNDYNRSVQGWLDLVHPDDRAMMGRYLKDEVVAKRQPFNKEYRIVHKESGETRWVSGLGELNFDAEGNAVSMIGTIQDITERKRGEETLMIFREALENSVDAIGMATPDGAHYYQNKSFQELFGDIGENPSVIFVDKKIAAEVFGAIKAGGSWIGETGMYSKEGQVRDVFLRAYANRDSLGNITALVGVHTDITERKLAEQAVQEQEARFRYLLETSPVAVRVLSVTSGKVLFTNQRYAALHNTTPDKLVGLSPRQYYSNAEEYDDILRQVTRGGPVFDKLIQLNLPGHGTMWMMASYLPMEYRGEPTIIGWFYDVTELRNANEKLQLASLVYENSSEAMIVTDAQGTILTVNPAFTKVTGYTPEEAIGKTTKILNSGRHDATFFQAMWKELNATGHWQGEIWNRRKNGEIYVEWLTINTIYHKDGSEHQRVALFTDITRIKKSDELIWQQANFDQLTGLPNRRMFHDRLEQEIKKVHRSGLPLAVLFLDLDRFKEVNDTLGHDMGDVLLQEAARRLTACVRETDTVARLGGDEFTLILSDLEEPGSVERVAQDILRQLAEPFTLGEEAAYVSASIGITFYPEDAANIEDLLKNADQAMYAAKQQGRNRYHYFTASMQEAAQARMRLANDLRNALAEHQLRVYYQPIVELATGAIHKAEALIRWQHPTRGLISPAEFIPIAEDTGLIIDIGNWVFHEAARNAKRLRVLHNPQFQISVNKSPVQFQSSEAHTQWFDYLRDIGLPGSGIAVEITESLLLDASDTVNSKLLEFRDAGMHVSLDDFGTGYSSLAYLKKFHIDFLKIDRSFVSNLTPGSSDMALVEAIIVMSHKLSMKVIAEGVETEQQRDLLKAAGCDYGQGYLFSRPVAADQFEKLLLA